MIQLRRDDFARFAPRAKKEYVEALFANIDKVRDAGLLESKRRLCHFLGQCSAETDGFVIVRESLNYRTVRAIRNAWRSRASNLSDGWIEANLLGNPVALGDWAYGGRMGNRKGTTDGFAYRGGGWIQTTGKDAVEDYCKKLGVPLREDTLDDIGLTLRFALFEWTEGNCNAMADADNVVGISKYINTGSAKSGVQPNGMDRRRQEVAKAMRIWGDASETEAEPVRPFPEVEPVSKPKVAAKSTSIRVLIAGAFAKVAAWLESVFDVLPDASDQVSGLMAPIQTIGSALKVNMAEITGFVVVGCLVVVAIRHVNAKAELKALKGE